MSELQKKYIDRIIDAANELHQAICTFQNSGEIDEIACSYYLAEAEDLREKLFDLYEQAEQGNVL